MSDSVPTPSPHARIVLALGATGAFPLLAAFDVGAPRGDDIARMRRRRSGS